MSRRDIELWIGLATNGLPHVTAAALSEIRHADTQRESESYRQQELELLQKHPGLLPAVLRMVQWSVFQPQQSHTK